jgi:ribA/ribD-fused uncharacterized protein
VETLLKMDVTEESNVILFDKTSRFSNDSFTPFFSDGLEFKSITHFMEYHKARLFKRSGVMRQIVSSKTVQQCETHLNDLVYNELAQWYNEAEGIVLKGLLCKFKQHPSLASALMKTKGSELVLCSSEEAYWGNGLDRADARKVSKRRWPGQNKLGALLMHVRSMMTTTDDNSA